MKLILFFVTGAALSWLMWIKGYSVIQQKMAVAFIGRRGKNHWGAGMTSATGWTKRVLPVEEGKKYSLYYDVNLTDGDILVEITHNKNLVCSFDTHNRTAILPRTSGRYVIITRFKKASGDYELKWEEI